MHSADYVASRREVYVFRGGNGREYLKTYTLLAPRRSHGEMLPRLVLYPNNGRIIPVRFWKREERYYFWWMVGHFVETLRQTTFETNFFMEIIRTQKGMEQNDWMIFTFWMMLKCFLKGWVILLKIVVVFFFFFLLVVVFLVTNGTLVIVFLFCLCRILFFL